MATKKTRSPKTEITDSEASQMWQAIHNEREAQLLARWEKVQSTAAELGSELKPLQSIDSAHDGIVTLWNLALKHSLEDWRLECLVMGYVPERLRRDVAMGLRGRWGRAVAERAEHIEKWATLVGLHVFPVVEGFWRHTYREYWGNDPKRSRTGTLLSGEPQYDVDMLSALNRISAELWEREESWWDHGGAVVKEIPYPNGTAQVEREQNHWKLLEEIGKDYLSHGCDPHLGKTEGWEDGVWVSIYPGDQDLSRDFPEFDRPYYLVEWYALETLADPRHEAACDVLRKHWGWRHDGEPFPLATEGGDAGQDPALGYGGWEKAKKARSDKAPDLTHLYGDVMKILNSEEFRPKAHEGPAWKSRATYEAVMKIVEQKHRHGKRTWEPGVDYPRHHTYRSWIDKPPKSARKS